MALLIRNLTNNSVLTEICGAVFSTDHDFTMNILMERPTGHDIIPHSVTIFWQLSVEIVSMSAADILGSFTYQLLSPWFDSEGIELRTAQTRNTLGQQALFNRVHGPYVESMFLTWLWYKWAIWTYKVTGQYSLGVAGTVAKGDRTILFLLK